jgi:hypothetical protein
MVCLNTQFHIPDSSTSLHVAIKTKAKQNLSMATMLLFYTPQEYYIDKAYYLSTYSMLKLLY